VIPMTEFSLGLTGDINDIMNAHNLAMVAMTSPHAARAQLQ
jgi:formyltetrahydrofolate synthetase